jgi:hypothetical protein
MLLFQDEPSNLAAYRFGGFFKDQSFLMRLKKTRLPYPITDVNHLQTFE